MEWTRKTQLERIIDRWTAEDGIFNRLKTAKENICNFFRPDLGIDYDETADMLMLGGDITEGSGPWVARKAATAFQGNTVSKKLDWYQYKFSDDDLNGIDELDKFRQDIKDHTSAVYQRGNFYDIQPQFTLDGWTIGDPLFFIEEDDYRSMCVPVHWQTYRIFYDRFNRSEGVIIKDTEWTAKMCFDKFCPGRDMKERIGQAEKKFSTKLFNAIKSGNMHERVTIWRAVFKSTDPIWYDDDFKIPFKIPMGRKSWFSVYFEDITGARYNSQQEDTRNIPLLVEGYFSKPFVHWPFDKKTWESASRTPSFHAIYDNLTLIQIFRNWIDNTQLRTRPPVATLLDQQGRIDLRPGAEMQFKPDEWEYLPKPIDLAGDVRLEKEIIDDLRNSLSRHFSLDIFTVFTDHAMMKNQELRVMQIAEIAGEKITMLLPAIESHENYLYQVDERIRAIEIAAGRGPFSRRNIENIIDIIRYYTRDTGKAVIIEPEFVGTLRRVQQEQQKLKSIRVGVGALAEIGQAMEDPDYVRFMLKGYEVGDKALQAVNFPQELINEKNDVEKLYDAKNQMNAQREQFAQMVELMKANKGQAQPLLEGQR